MSFQSIILADDDSAIRQLLTRVLQMSYPQAQIITATNGREALDAYRLAAADLIITDYAMPHMDGLALLSALRALQPTVPILVISADATCVPAARAAGATSILLKPFPLAQFRQVLQTLEEAEQSALADVNVPGDPPCLDAGGSAMTGGCIQRLDLTQPR